jgi:hypothetical protein
MAAKAWATAQSQQKAGKADEIFVQNEAVSLCFLVNRRARIMRVVDFRAGPSIAKRRVVLSVAQRESVEKVYTLVERDEVQTWQKLGFVKEGNIPGFYKRSDAFMLGCIVPSGPPLRPLTRGRPLPEADHLDDVPMQSETRLIIAEPATGPAPLSEAHQRMERTIVLAKRAAKDLATKALPQAKVTVVGETEARKAVAAALHRGDAMTGFEPFGRDVVRRYFAVTARGGFTLQASTESQVCFGNAYLELLRGPRNDAEIAGTTAALRSLCEKLMSEEVVSCFSLAPTDDVALGTAFAHNGFRRTGLLADHLFVGGRRKDAILWSRKMANPTEE